MTNKIKPRDITVLPERAAYRFKIYTNLTKKDHLKIAQLIEHSYVCDQQAGGRIFRKDLFSRFLLDHKDSIAFEKGVLCYKQQEVK